MSIRGKLEPGAAAIYAYNNLIGPNSGDSHADIDAQTKALSAYARSLGVTPLVVYTDTDFTHMELRDLIYDCTKGFIAPTIRYIFAESEHRIGPDAERIRKYLAEFGVEMVYLIHQDTAPGDLTTEAWARFHQSLRETRREAVGMTIDALLRHDLLMLPPGMTVEQLINIVHDSLYLERAVT